MECKPSRSQAAPANGKYKPTPDVEAWMRSVLAEAPPLSDWQRRIVAGAFHGDLPAGNRVR